MVIMDSEFFNEYLRYRKEDGRLDIKREFAAVPKTITIKDLKNTGEVSALCGETNEPISIIEMGIACWWLSVLRGMRNVMRICGMVVINQIYQCVM